MAFSVECQMVAANIFSTVGKPRRDLQHVDKVFAVGFVEVVKELSVQLQRGAFYPLALVDGCCLVDDIVSSGIKIGCHDFQVVHNLRQCAAGCYAFGCLPPNSGIVKVDDIALLIGSPIYIPVIRRQRRGKQELWTRNDIVGSREHDHTIAVVLEVHRPVGACHRVGMCHYSQQVDIGFVELFKSARRHREAGSSDARLLPVGSDRLCRLEAILRVLGVVLVGRKNPYVVGEVDLRSACHVGSRRFPFHQRIRRGETDKLLVFLFRARSGYSGRAIRHLHV